MSDIYQRIDRQKASTPGGPTYRQQYRAFLRRVTLISLLVGAVLVIGIVVHLTWRARARIAPRADAGGVPLSPGHRAPMEWYAPGGDQGVATAFARVREAHALLRDGRAPEAERALGEVLAEHPDYDPALRLLGLLYARQARHADALAVFDRALRHAETRAETLNNMATVLMRQDALAQAEQRLREALHIQPDQVGANLNLALLHITRQEYEEAIPRLAAVYKALPHHPGVLNNLAVCRMRTGDPAAARDLFLTALTNAPPSAPVQFNIAMTFALQTNAAEALRWIRVARTNCTALEASAALADPDFAAVRGDPEWAALVKTFRAEAEAEANEKPATEARTGAGPSR